MGLSGRSTKDLLQKLLLTIILYYHNLRAVYTNFQSKILNSGLPLKNSQLIGKLFIRIMCIYYYTHWLR